MEDWNQTDGLETEEQETEQERERRQRRRQRIEQMQREKKRAQLVQRLVPPVAAGVLLVLVIGFAAGRLHGGAADADRSGTAVASGEVTPTDGGTPQAGNTAQPEAEGTGSTAQPETGSGAAPQAGSTAQPAAVTTNGEVFGPFPTEEPQQPVFSAAATAQTHGFGDEIVSQYGILIDVAQGEIVAQKDAGVRMNPASMTKVLTVLTAAEALGLTGEDWEEKEVLDDKFTITIEITDYSYVHDCSNVGFEIGEEVTVRDLFYGTILPSGGDAALGLACYVAGSQEAFVEMMNDKLAELGLSDTSHFTNCVGLYDKEHYCTAYDMAVMLKTATDSPFCRQVLSAHTYTTAPTQQHPEGLLISNWFLRRIEDRDTHGEVICGKTGYVAQSGSCAASLASDAFGKEYVCVTAASSSSWQCIYDQTALFQRYLDSGQTAALP